VLRTGVDGYILKNSSPEDIIEAVHSVAAGERYIGQGVSKSIVANFVRQVREEEYNPDSRPRRLTKREVEIVRCIAAGMTSKEISDALHVSIRTVQSHRLNIMQKLDIHEIAGLVMYAVKNGLVESG
jgi:DNA-binding NarL/FixJ family response regulator